MKRFFIASALIIALASAGTIFPLSVSAQQATGTELQSVLAALLKILRSTGFGAWVPAPYPFGGNVTLVQQCQAPPGAYLVTVGQPNPGQYIVVTPIGTTCYDFGCPGIFGWVLGGASEYAECDTDLGKGTRITRTRIIRAQPGVGSSGTGNGNNNASTTNATSSPQGGECKNGIPFKPGVGTQLKPDIKKSLEGFCDAAKNLDWQVTEGCPNTTAHQNACHANCTCVDVGFQSRQYTAQKVNAAISAGSQVGANLVFETNDPGLANTLLQSGLSPAQVKYYPQVTGSHFSYYCPGCKP